MTIEEIERFILSADQQPPLVYVADSLGISNTQVLSKAKAKYGSYRMMIKSLRGTYFTSGNEKYGRTAAVLFDILDNLLNVKGVREHMIEGLVNPQTNFPLRIDYFAESIPLAVEYHGEQHYKNVHWFRHPDRKTKWSLKGQKARDKIKVDFLKKRGIYEL
ncbi:hypothetical protein [Brevibacillus centrosporus]|uniref:hypothetical protein n=1 Tax=Brevibacillus centrosporus TaxID=54910 RepID=UPI0037F530E8